MLESKFPNRLGNRYARLVGTDAWKRKTIYEPQAYALKKVLSERQFDDFVAFAVKHCGVSFFRDGCINCLLGIDDGQRKQFETIRKKTSKELVNRKKRWNDVIKAHSANGAVSPELRKQRLGHLRYLRDVEREIFNVLTESQKRQLRKWRTNPVELQRYVSTHDAWITFVPEKLFPLPPGEGVGD